MNWLSDYIVFTYKLHVHIMFNKTIPPKDLSSHEYKLIFCNPQIFAVWWCKLFIFQTGAIEFNIVNSLKSDFVAKNKFLWLNVNDFFSF